MSNEDEFTVWCEQWQSGPAVPIQLLQRVERQTAQMQMMRAAEIAVTLLMGGAVLAGAIVHPFLARGYWLALAAGTWLFIAAAWFVGIRSTRSVWEANELTTDAYVSLRVRRLRRQIEGTLRGAALSVLFSTFVLFVVFEALARTLSAHGARLGGWDVAPFWIVGGVVNLFVVLALVGSRRKAQSELARMVEIQRRLERSEQAGNAGSTDPSESL